MSLLLKDPAATLDYSVDWGADYLSDDALASSAWGVEPAEPGGASIAGHSFDLLVAAASIAGGVPGRVYRLTNQIVTASGHIDSRSIMLRVEKR